MEEPILAHTHAPDLGVSTPARCWRFGVPLVRVRTHRLLGTLGCASFGVVAFVVGAVGVLMAPATAVGGVGLGVVVGVLASRHPPGSTATAKWAVLASRRHRGLVAGATTTATWVVATGAVFLLGPASPIILAALLLTGLPAIWLWRRFGAAAPDAPTSTPTTPAAAQPTRITLDQMSTSELCGAWRRSYWALLDEPDGKCRCAIVHLRQTLLDELERRDANGFGRWLNTGARAGSDPGRYLTPDP